MPMKPNDCYWLVEKCRQNADDHNPRASFETVWLRPDGEGWVSDRAQAFRFKTQELAAQACFPGESIPTEHSDTPWPDFKTFVPSANNSKLCARCNGTGYYEGTSDHSLHGLSELCPQCKGTGEEAA